LVLLKSDVHHTFFLTEFHRLWKPPVRLLLSKGLKMVFFQMVLKDQFPILPN